MKMRTKKLQRAARRCAVLRSRCMHRAVWMSKDSDPLATWAEKNPDTLRKMAFYGAQVAPILVMQTDIAVSENLSA